LRQLAFGGDRSELLQNLQMDFEFWIRITHLGNSALLIPAAVVLALCAWRAGQGALALAWTLSFGIALFIVLTSKLAFLGWGIGSAAIDFTGISGHTTVSTAVLTMGLWLLAAGGSKWQRVLAVSAGLLLGALVGFSRLALDVHSVSEVVAGFGLGAAAALLAIAYPQLVPRAMSHRWVLLAMFLALVLAPQMGRPAEAHGLVVKMALIASGRDVPFNRTMLHRRAGNS